MCDKDIYVSGALSGDDGPFEALAECNGMPDCGFRVYLGGQAFGITGSELLAVIEAHASDGPRHLDQTEATLSEGMRQLREVARKRSAV